MQRIERIQRVKCAMLCMARQCWEQGLAAQAMYALGDNESLILLARDAVLRQKPDGRLCDVENTPAIVDPAICVEPVLLAGKLTGEPEFEKAARKNIDYLLKVAPHAEDGTYFHLEGSQEVWADAASMSPPSLSLMGYYDEAVAQMKGILKRLYDKKTGAYFHIWDEEKQCYSREKLWGVGNGWIVIGLMNLIHNLPSDYKQRPELIVDLHNLIDAFLKFNRVGGLFHNILDDDTTFVETESAEMLAYAIYKSVKSGFLDARYLADADELRKAIYEKVGENGIVMDSVSSPLFDRPGSATESQAHFLLMEAASLSLQ